MAIIRITDKPELTQFDDVRLLATDMHDAKDYQVSGEGVAKVVADKTVYEATCETAAHESAKRIDIVDLTEIILGMEIWVTFLHGNSASDITLSINGENSNPIKVQGNPVAPGFIESDKKYKLEFTGTSWDIINQGFSRNEFLLLKNPFKKTVVSDFNDSSLLVAGSHHLHSLSKEIPNGPEILNEQTQISDASLFVEEGDGFAKQYLSWVCKDKLPEGMNYSLVRTVKKTEAGEYESSTSWDSGAERDINGNYIAAREDTPTDGGYAIWNEATQKFNTTKEFNGTNATLTGNLNVEGTITQSGEGFETHLEDLTVKDNTINLREGSTGTGAGLGPTEHSGLVIQNYDGTDKNLNLVVDNKGEARLGKDDNLEPLMTRAEQTDMSDKGVVIWNDSKRRAETLTVPEGSEGKVLVYNGPDEAGNPQPPSFEKYKTAASWTGTKAEFETAKTVIDPESDDYLEDKQIVNITDDECSANVSSEVREGDFNPVSGDAVFNHLAKIVPDFIYKYDFFSMSDRFIKYGFTNRRSIKIKANTFIKLETGTDERWFKILEDEVIDISSQMQNAVNASSYRTGELNGRNFYIYLAPLGEKEIQIVISCNSTYPNDIDSSFTALNTRKIGQFHTLCSDSGNSLKMSIEASPSSGETVGDNYLIKPYDSNEDNDFYEFYNKKITNVSTGSRYDVITTEHPLAGFKAGDILPESVWCLNFLTYSSPDGMVFDIETFKGYDIYGQSGVSKNTASEYGASWTDTRPQENHVADMRQVRKELVSSDEFTSMAIGSNVKTNIANSRDPITTGGHIDTAGSRMISAIGVEDCCGALWQWSREVGPAGGSGWSGYDGQSSFGQTYGTIYGLRCGGDWTDGSYCGPRSRSVSGALSRAAGNVGGRGSSWLKFGFRN